MRTATTFTPIKRTAKQASQPGLESIAFCLLAEREACLVSLSAVVRWFKRRSPGDTLLRKVVFRASSDASFDLYTAELGIVQHVSMMKPHERICEDAEA